MNRFLQILLALLCSGAIYAQKISFDTSHGLPGTITGKNYVWKSPEINLGKAVNGVRITFLETEGGDSHNGFPIVALGELEVYNSNNNKITFSKVSTNSLKTSEGSIEALNDGKYSTFYHSKWNKGTSPNDYVYLDITFNTSIENFSIKQVSRETKRLMGTYICITPVGVAWNEVSDVVGGTTADGLNWSFNTITNELKISGNGPMHNYWETNDKHQWENYKKLIKKITILEGITYIGSMAFEGCVSAQEIKIPKTVTSIGKFAFYRCNSLKSIYIPEGVESIGDNTFAGCTSLVNINIPKSLTYLGKDVYSELPFYKNSENGIVYLDNWAVGFKGEVTNNDKYIIKEGCIGITPYLLAYNNCSEITLPSSLKYFASYAFYNCSAKININCDLPDGNYFFGNNFEEIVFGENVKYIGDVIIGNGALKTVTIGSNVKTIGQGVFQGSTSMTSVKMGNSVKTIGDYAFYDCNSLTLIELPQGLDSIGSFAFSNCFALKKITIPSSVTKLGYGIVLNNTCPLYINCDIPNNERYIFRCDATKIILGNNVRKIGDWAFSDCSKLKEFEMPNSVKYVGDYAFLNCASLEKLKMSESLTHIGESAFNGCNLLQELVLPHSLKTIGSYAFLSCSGTIIINCNLPDRDSEASATFLGCSASKFVIGGGVTDIGNFSFYYCTKMSNINIPNSVKRIGDKAFSYCENLKEINIGSGIEYIGGYAFQGCDNIQKVNISDVNKWCNIDFENQLSNPISLAKEFYVNGNLLTSLEINNGVNIIKPYTFNNCKNIENVNIPASVSEVCDYSFEGCRALKNIYIDCMTPPTLGYDAFFNTIVENRGTLYVPSGTKALYSAADVWNYFRNIVEQGDTKISSLESSYNVKFINGVLIFEDIPIGLSIEIYSSSGILLNKFTSEGANRVSTNEKLVFVKIGNNPPIKVANI